MKQMILINGKYFGNPATGESVAFLSKSPAGIRPCYKMQSVMTLIGALLFLLGTKA